MSSISLTQKQENFAQGVFTGLDASKAYRAAYDAGNMNENTIWRKAYDLMKNDKVAARLAELRASAAERSEITLESLTEKLEALHDKAAEAGDHSSAVAALRQISKMHGLDADKRKNERDGISELPRSERIKMKAFLDAAVKSGEAVKH